jgi:hypothetical protein
VNIELIASDSSALLLLSMQQESIHSKGQHQKLTDLIRKATNEIKDLQHIPIHRFLLEYNSLESS